MHNCYFLDPLYFLYIMNHVMHKPRQAHSWLTGITKVNLKTLKSSQDSKDYRSRRRNVELRTARMELRLCIKWLATIQVGFSNFTCTKCP